MRLKEGGQVQEMTRIDPSLLPLVMDEGGHDPRNGGGHLEVTSPTEPIDRNTSHSTP